MIIINKLVNHNCTDQTTQAGLCLRQVFTRGAHLILWIIKEDDSCAFTADEQIGALKRRYLIGFRSNPHLNSDNDCIYPNN